MVCFTSGENVIEKLTFSRSASHSASLHFVNKGEKQESSIKATLTQSSLIILFLSMCSQNVLQVPLFKNRKLKELFAPFVHTVRGFPLCYLINRLQKKMSPLFQELNLKLYTD